MTRPWKRLCVDLFGPFSLKRQGGSEADLMCLTMINTAMSCFKIVELPVVEKPKKFSLKSAKCM